MVKKIMRALLGAVVLGLVFSFFSYIGSHNMGVFNPKGPIARAEMNLITNTVMLMLVVVVPVFILLGAFLWRYRAGNTNAKYRPDWQSNTILEIVWWTIPIVIIGIIGRMTWVSRHDLDPYKPIVSDIAPLTIEVVALDWKWLFIYPEQNIATVNFVQFPKDTPIHFKITADAPMNSFWIPQLAGQIYAMPGMNTSLNIVATDVGNYLGMSSNYSGAGFSGMKFVARASTDSQFDAWVDTVRRSPDVLEIEQYKMLAEKSRNNSITYYSRVAEDLYGTIINKFMLPSGAPVPKRRALQTPAMAM